MVTKWDRKRSEWYCRAIEQSNYPKKTLAALAPLLRKCESVIDIGAGCGALSLPIARKVGSVTALEPSKWMYGLLLRRAEREGMDNIRAFHAGWKGTSFRGNLNGKLKPHDMAVCANLPHHVICDERFLRSVTEMSTRYVVYIQSAGGWNRFYYRELYPMLMRKKYSNECDYINTYTFLHKHDIFANVRIFQYSLDQPFENFDDALDFWRHRLGIALTRPKEKLLIRFLKKKLIARRDGTLIAPFGLRRAALTWWNSC